MNNHEGIKKIKSKEIKNYSELFTNGSESYNKLKE